MDEKTTSKAEKMLAMSRQRDGKSAPVIDKKDVLSIAVDYMQNDIALESFNSEESEAEYHVSRSCEDVVQGLFGNLKRFRIYGSVTRFVEELMIFQNFPGSHKNFSMSATSKYYTVPVIYYSRGRREKFVCKQDLFSILHHLMLKTIPLSQIPLIRSMTTVFLKKEEEKLGGRMQFVKYSAEEMKSIEMDLSETQLTFIDEQQKLKSTFFKEEILEKLRSDFSNCSLVEILAKFTKLVPMNWGVKESANIRKGLESVECFHDPHEWLRFVVCSYTNTICIIKKFEAIIKKRPHMFKDSSRFKTQLGLESESSPEDTSSPSSSPSRPTVRLFEDGPLRYVMRDEMLMAIGYTCSCRKDTIKSDFCCEADKKTVLGMPLEEVMRKYRDRVDDIDFIRIPILRTRHRAVPISASSILCQFYVPAVDGLLEILKSLIWGSRIFQAFPVKRKKDLYELFAVLGSLLQCQNDFPFFIQRSELLQITLLCAQKCSFHSKSELTEVRDVPENGFTLQALKSEIKYLELPGFLPDILNHAKRVYQEIDRNKKDQVLRTCDMFEAIESCQLISIFNLFPKLKSFLHAQKCCRRIPGLHCDTCKEFTSSEFTQKEGPPTEKFVELADLCMDAKDMVQKLIAHGQYCSSEDDDDDEDGDSDDVGDEEEEEDDSDFVCTNTECSECRIPKKFKNIASQTDHCCGYSELMATDSKVDEARIRIEAFEKTLDQIAEENQKMMERVKKDLKKKHEEVEALKRKMKMFDAIQKKCSGHEKKVMELEEMLKKKEKEVEECKRDLATINTTTRSKIENLEKELKKTQKQSETLKSKLTTKCSQNSTILDENEKLRIRLAETESREILNKEHYQISKTKFDEDRAKFSERIAEIGRELRSEKTRIQTLESQLREAETIRINTAENVQHREKDMANQMQHHMQIIHESNVNLRAESEMQKRTIHELMRRLEIFERQQQRNLQHMEATNYQNYQPPSPSSHHHQLQYHHQNAYRTPQEDPLLPSPKSTKLLLPIGAERAANRTPKQDSAPFSTTSPFPLFYPNSGIQNLENSILQNLNMNLETSSSSNPENQMTSMDTECVICLTEMQYGDYTIKCHQCRRRLHSQCASDWLKVRSICPTCQGQLLDPNEFSTL